MQIKPFRPCQLGKKHAHYVHPTSCHQLRLERICTGKNRYGKTTKEEKCPNAAARELHFIFPHHVGSLTDAVSNSTAEMSRRRQCTEHC
jgi:hypothetical protein